MYRVIDSYGTNQIAWSWRAALEWLAASSPDAKIINRITRRVIAARVVVS